MVVDDQEALVSDLHELVADGYDAFHLREDVTPRLAEIADELHDDLVLQGIGRDRLEDLFDAGRLHCSMHRFDDLTAFHFVAAELTGLFVTVDSGTEVPLASFAAACESRLP